VKRAYRLRHPRDFRRVRRDGRVYSHRLLRLTVAPNRRNRIRCGFVVGKHIGNAVQRNRARRRVREVVRLDFEHLARGVDLVFVIRSPDTTDVPFARLQEVVRQLLTQANVWHDALHEQQHPAHRQTWLS
jgi:ribonuclease P protein component